MYQRLQEDSSKPLIVIHTPDRTHGWPTEQVITDGNELRAVRARLLFFPEGARTPSMSRSATIETPAGTILRWAEYLRPPIGGPPPPFDLEEAHAMHAEPVATLRARSSGRVSDISLLVNTIHLSTETIERAARIVFTRLSGASWPIAWSVATPAALGRALYEHHQLLAHAHSREDRSDYLRLRAVADEFWMHQVLPLANRAEEFRAVRVPEAEEAWADQRLDYIDQRLLQRSLPNLASADPYAVQQKDSSPPPPREFIAQLATWEGIHPQIRVRNALAWLDSLTHL